MEHNFQKSKHAEKANISMLNKEITEFRTYAYHEKEFKFVSKDDIPGKQSVFFFFTADFTFVSPTELEDLAEAVGVSLSRNLSNRQTVS